jgi:V8-like Glu-specific endopeptidase
LSLGRVDEAVKWLGEYVDAPGTDAFELGSTLRQLIEVWRLDGEREPGTKMLPLLRAKLLTREGGQITVSPAEVGRQALERVDQAPNLERVFGAERFQSLRWFREALERCRAVARIEDEFEEGIGTGFLLEGKALKDSLPEVVMMTNAHVIPEGIAPEDAYITFRGLDTPGDNAKFRVEKVLWSSSRKELDATIFVLQTIPRNVTPCPVASKPPPLDSTPPPRAFIVGHPRGGLQPMFSIQDNLMLDYDEVKVHYRAPTEPGSSGSPVFDRYWKLIALHHAGSEEMPKLHGGGTYQANEGIWIGRIQEALLQMG